MSWRSKDESKLKEALNDLKNLELSQIKASDKSTIEIMIFFTEILISVHSEENIKFDLILNFVNQKKRKPLCIKYLDISIIHNIFDSRDIYSKLQVFIFFLIARVYRPFRQQSGLSQMIHKKISRNNTQNSINLYDNFKEAC